jgi:hypothetical protein
MNIDDSTDDLWWPEDNANSESLPDAPPRPKRGAKTWILAGAGAIAIAALSVVVINVASSHSATAGGTAPPGFGRNGPGGGRGNAGTIASIDGTTITLTTQTGTTKVVASANTTVSLSVAGAIGDIKTGDHVVVMGAASGATVAADRIVDTGTNATTGFGGRGGGPGGPPPAGGPSGNPPAGGPRGGGGFVTGTVASIGATSLTITVPDGTTTNVTTTSSTQVTTEKTGTLQDLATGDQVTVSGTTASDGTVTATAIRQGGMR